MYYDDQARRFNLASGLAIGTLVGAGLALLSASARASEREQSLRRVRGRLREGGEPVLRGLRRASERVRDGVW